MSDWTQETVDEAIKSVAERATTDEKFRKKVLKNPKDAIKEVTGKDVPANYRLKIIESAPDFDNIFVLPPFRSDELSEAELEQVAGGSFKEAMEVTYNVLKYIAGTIAGKKRF